MLPVIAKRMSAPVRVIPLPPVKSSKNYRWSNKPGAAAPIDILAATHAYVFIPVPSIIIRGVGYISCWWRDRGW
jgi:hypothetical protein